MTAGLGRTRHIRPVHMEVLIAGVGERRYPCVAGWHRMPGTLFEWATGGAWIVEVGDDPPVRAPAGRVLVVPSGRRHRLSMAPGPPMQSQWLAVGIEFPNGIDLLHRADLPTVLSPAASGRIQPLLRRLARAANAYSPRSLRTAVAVNLLTFQVIALLLGQPEVDTRSGLAPEDLERLNPVLEYIEAHLGTPLSRGLLARQAGLSPTRFHYVFKSAMGMAPMAYVERRRIQSAQRLLLGSGLAVKEIAFRCGYASAPYFNRAFRRVAGRSPGAFRKSLR
ncbi:MAG: helix-turn-helix transcriptional regulator [Kiritimatiellae bacterium]|nr:helix-turn-helix transcriptional regulator [Kiritimatiellia bacterium]